jgi:hypothetical protein
VRWAVNDDGVLVVVLVGALVVVALATVLGF